MSTEALTILVLAIGGLLVVAGTAAYLYYVRVWFRAFAAGAPVSFKKLFAYSGRGMSPFKIVSAYVAAKEADIVVTLEELETQYGTGADMRRAVRSMVASREQGRVLRFEEACAATIRKDATVSAVVKQEG